MSELSEVLFCEGYDEDWGDGVRWVQLRVTEGKVGPFEEWMSTRIAGIPKEVTNAIAKLFKEVEHEFEG